MVISSFISSILVLTLGIWAYLKLESTMNIVAEKQLLIEPSKFSYKMWKDMPVTMYQSFTFFNLTNWNQVKSIGQKPKFVEVGPYVYKTIWTKSDINFLDDDKMINFAEKKQWIFQPLLSKGYEEDLIWTINTPLMTALALIQNAPVITRNIVSVILDGLGEGAFIKRNIKSLLFDGYSDLIVSVGPLFDRRFANFNGKFAYLYNKNDSIDGQWTVSTGVDDLASLNKIIRFQSNIVNMTSQLTGQIPQGLNEVKPECSHAWSLDQATNGQLFSPFNKDLELYKLKQQIQKLKSIRSVSSNQKQINNNNLLPPEVVATTTTTTTTTTQTPLLIGKRFFSRSLASHDHHHNHHNHQNNNNNNHQQAQELISNPFLNQKTFDQSGLEALIISNSQSNENNINLALSQLKDVGKFIFYPDLCRPIHLLPSKQPVYTSNGIQASRYFIDPKVFMNSSQVPTNKCYEMNPKPPLANALAATINSVTGANVAMPNLVSGASSPFAMFSSNSQNNANHNNPHQHHHGLSLVNLGLTNNNNHHHENGVTSLFERSNNPASFINNALQTLGAVQQNQADQLASSSTNGAPISRLGRVRQLFSNIVSQRMSVNSPNSLLPSLSSGPAGLLAITNHHNHNLNQPTQSQLLNLNARNSPDELTINNKQTPLTSIEGSNLRQQQLAEQSSQSVPIIQSLPQQQQQQQQTTPSLGLPPLIQPQLPSLHNNNHHHYNQQQHQPAGGSDRWITQFRFKWPRGVFSIGQCQLGAPIYASLPHFLDADEYYLEQVDGLKPNRSLHEFYIDIESTLHSVPVNAKARLQLNVATPELRFRNIPNAMIPVLWQEVTFSIDKPIATMLYWSFTMSSTIYKTISILLLLTGGSILIVSFVGAYKEHLNKNNNVDNNNRRQQKNRISCSSTSSSTTNSNETLESTTSQQVQAGIGSLSGQVAALANATANSANINYPIQLRGGIVNRIQQQQQQQQQQQGLSWQPHLIQHQNKNMNTNNKDNFIGMTIGDCQDNCDTLENDIRLHGAALNQAFTSSCADFTNNHYQNNDNNNNNNINEQIETSGSSSPLSSSNCHKIMKNCFSNAKMISSHSSSCTNSSGNISNILPKQPSSRASSNCELVSSNGIIHQTTSINCTGCLLACLRHNNDSNIHNIINNNDNFPTTKTNSSDNSIVRHNHNTTCNNIDHFHNQKHTKNLKQHIQNSDIDKATLSSRDSCSNLDSCSPIIYNANNNDDK